MLQTQQNLNHEGLPLLMQFAQSIPKENNELDYSKIWYNFSKQIMEGDPLNMSKMEISTRTKMGAGNPDSKTDPN